MQETKDLNEALGRKESELFSKLENETVTITAVEFSEFTQKGKDGKDETVKQAFINIEGSDTLYRSSGKAILDTLAKIEEELPVRATVQKIKSKGSKYSYIALVAPKPEA